MICNMSDDSPCGADATGLPGKPVPVLRRVRPAYEQVAAQLRESIVRGEIAVGDRLLVVSELPAFLALVVAPSARHLGCPPRRIVCI